MSYPGEWPSVSELRKLVDVPADDAYWTVTLERQMAAGIELVKSQVGTWDDLNDLPDDMLAGAALRAAFLLSLKESPATILADSVFAGYMNGHRRRFAIS